MWFPNRSDKNRPVQSQKRARILKFRIYVEEELYYPSSENKGADQLRGYREADLRLCFCLGRLLVFPCDGSNVKMPTIVGILTFMCRINFSLSRVEHEKSFIISGPGEMFCHCDMSLNMVLYPIH